MVVERGRGFGDVLVSLSRQPAKICVVVKIMAPFVGTQNIRCRIIIRTQNLTGPKPKEIEVETFRIDYLVRTPKVEKLSLQPIGKGTIILTTTHTVDGQNPALPIIRNIP